MAILLRFLGLIGVFSSLNPCRDFHQIFRMCLSQEDIELIWFGGYLATAVGGPQWPSGLQVWHLIIGCQLCGFRVPQVAMLRTCTNMSVAVEGDVKS